MAQTSGHLEAGMELGVPLYHGWLYRSRAPDEVRQWRGCFTLQRVGGQGGVAWRGLAWRCGAKSLLP